MPGVADRARSTSTDHGWRARLELGLRPGPDRTLLHHRRRLGPLAVQRPFYPEGRPCHVYLLHPPGGIVGGDQLELEVRLEPDSHGLITSPGATKFYRSAGPLARVEQQFTVGDGACLEWLPQETILFPGARVASRTDIRLTRNARLAYWDLWCLGRPLIDEAFDDGAVDALLQVSRDGDPVLHDRLRVDPVGRHWRCHLAGRPVVGQLLLTPVDAGLFDRLQELEANTAAAWLALTLIDDLLIARFLGDSVAAARERFLKLWMLARTGVIGQDPIIPRIWST